MFSSGMINKKRREWNRALQHPGQIPVGGPGSTPAGPHGGPTSTSAKSGAGGTAPSRKHPAHPPVIESDNRSIIVFVTVCAEKRSAVLCNRVMHDLLVRAWTLTKYWNVGRYIIMPDHIHLFCAPGIYPPTSVKDWITYWKTLVARGIKNHGPLADPRGGPTSTSAEPGAGGTAPSSWPDPLWQRNFWDTQMRRGESYAKKWEYVRCNPVRAGLCADPDEWLFQGEMNVLFWHD